jgi:hypothetical protein
MEIYDLVLAGMGGLIGLLAGVFVSVILPKNGDGGTGPLGVLVVLGLMAGGAVLAPPHIEPHAAPYVRQALSGDINDQLPEMQTFGALYQAVRERDSHVANFWDAEVRTAYVADGLEAADQMARSEAFRMRGWVLNEFGARASDEALLTYLRTFAAGLRTGVIEDPRSCFAAFYPARMTPGSRPISTFPIASEDMAAAYAGIITSSGIADIEYERYDTHMLGLVVLQEVADQHGLMFDELRDAYPSTDTEYATMCAALTNYYDRLLEHPEGARLFRYSIS